jgi:hypothetical protein
MLLVLLVLVLVLVLAVEVGMCDSDMALPKHPQERKEERPIQGVR